ncbi:MAG: D-aminoacyl-tRNA deacylase [Halobacteriovoraceae bacterium]|nr:D-aminoacyl-tRNA deacylase [Halobacteriovoraceae bacterium]
MRVVIQRVSQAQVKVQNKVVGKIERGALLLVCFEKGDEDLDLEKVASKLLKLRYFEDSETGKMNQDIFHVKGKILSISQFTLSWDGKKGNRPSFDNSMEPILAEEKYQQFNSLLSREIVVETGVFGKHMDVSLENDGPVTFSLVF